MYDRNLVNIGDGYTFSFVGITLNNWINVGKSKLLPLANGERHFKFTYLRAPMELGDKIADSCVSAKVIFLLNFLSKNIHSARRNVF